MERDFGNEQDLSVHDKEHPTLGPTEEAQDVATLDRIVVPMPAYNDPNNPLAASGTINLSVNDHPVEHSKDYGQDVQPGTAEMQNPLSDNLRDLRGEGAQQLDLPEDREEWSKANWQAHAHSLGLSTSGSVAKLQERVEAHETAENDRAEFESEVKGMSREDLDNLATAYGLDPSEYSNKEDLTAAVFAAYDEQ